MSLRASLQSNPIVAVVVAVALIAVAAWIATRQGADVPANANLVYFYDLGAGQLFEVDAGRMPPIESPSGGIGVAAAVFACDNCDNAGERFTAYLRKLEPIEGTEDLRDFVAAVPESGEPTWHPMGSRAATGIVQAVQTRCGNDPERQLVACKP